MVRDRELPLRENSQLATEVGRDTFQAPRRRQVGLFAETESPADERAAERPEFRLIPAAGAPPVNSQSRSIAGQQTPSARSAARQPPCFATLRTSPIEGNATCRQNWHDH